MTPRIAVFGPGYSGGRFQQAFEHVCDGGGSELSVDRIDRTTASQLAEDAEMRRRRVDEADVIVNSTNDDQHESLLPVLKSSRGFIVWEKPLSTPGTDDGLSFPEIWLDPTRFALNCVERYSEAVDAFQSMVRERGLIPARINFIWAKNRFDDPRPTVGVASEVIHPLDMTAFLLGASAQNLRVQDSHVVESDYRAPGVWSPEAVQVAGTCGETTFTGYSSFGHPGRRRVFDITLTDRHGAREYVEITFDEPTWDRDRLLHWTDEKTLLDEWMTSGPAKAPSTCGKLTRFVEDVLDGRHGRRYTTLREALHLQQILDAVQAQSPTRAHYGGGPGRRMLDRDDLERLG